MFSLDLLRVPLARLVGIGVEMTGIRTPIIRGISRDPKGLLPRFDLLKYRIFRECQYDIYDGENAHLKHDRSG